MMLERQNEREEREREQKEERERRRVKEEQQERRLELQMQQYKRSIISMSKNQLLGMADECISRSRVVQMMSIEQRVFYV
jgi:hypothetical protein